MSADSDVDGLEDCKERGHVYMWAIRAVTRPPTPQAPCLWGVRGGIPALSSYVYTNAKVGGRQAFALEINLGATPIFHS